MAQKEKKQVWINRVLAFLFGGLVVFAVMSLAVTVPVKSRNATLTKQIDEIQYGAARLLDEANAFILIGSYEKAKSSLESLFEKHPASLEAAEGTALYVEIEATLHESEMKWDAAVETVKTAWESTRAEEIRAEFEQKRVLMETTMSETLAKEWEKSEATVREEWEKL